MPAPPFPASDKARGGPAATSAPAPRTTPDTPPATAPATALASDGHKLPWAVYRIEGDPDGNEQLWREIRREGEALVWPRSLLFPPANAHPFDCYCIERGSLRLEFVSREGRRRLLLVYGPGAIFNLACGLLEKDASGQAALLEDCRLWRVPGSLLRSPEGVARCPALAAHALRLLATVMLTYHEALTGLAVDDFYVRFCRYLLLNLRKFRTTTFSIGLSQEECAATLGATLARAVQWLKAEGVIAAFAKKGVYILDAEKLRRLAGL